MSCFKVCVHVCKTRVSKERLDQLGQMEAVDLKEKKDPVDQRDLMVIKDLKVFVDLLDLLDHQVMEPKDLYSTGARMTYITFRRLRR